MSNYADYKKEALENPEVKEEYDALDFEFTIRRALIEARKQQNMTQKELSIKSGVTQADISRFENGIQNPSLEKVGRLAKAMNVQIRLEMNMQNQKTITEHRD